MNNQGLKVIQYAIDKYQRLSRYIEFTSKDKGITRIVDDISILKYNCKFGLWYYEDGQNYNYMEAFQKIDSPYNEMFKSYYNLLTYLNNYKKQSVVSKILGKEDRAAKLLQLRIEDVKERCAVLVTMLKNLEAEFSKLTWSASPKLDKGKASHKENIIPILAENPFVSQLQTDAEFKSSQFEIMINKLDSEPQKENLLKNMEKEKITTIDSVLKPIEKTKKKKLEKSNIKIATSLISTIKKESPSLSFSNIEISRPNTIVETLFNSNSKIKDENSLLSMMKMSRSLK